MIHNSIKGIPKSPRLPEKEENVRRTNTNESVRSRG